MAMAEIDRVWLYREFEKLTEQIHGTQTLVREQNGRIGRSETRIAVIEAERESEEKQAIKRGTWAGILAAAGLTGLIEVVKVWAHR